MSSSSLCFESKSFLRKVRPLLPGSGADIISRSVCILPFKKTVRVLLTDQVSYTCIDIPGECTEGFPPTFKTDLRSLVEAARVSGDRVSLVVRKDRVYAQVFYGELYLPWYRMETSLYKPGLGGVVSSKEFSGEDVGLCRKAVIAASQVSSGSDVSDLSHVFVSEEGVFGCDGSVVVRTKGSFFPTVIRRKDISVLKALLEDVSEEDTVEFSQHSSFFRVHTEGFSYVYPLSEMVLSGEYLRRVGVAAETTYSICPSTVLNLLRLLVRMPGASELIECKLNEEVLLSSKSKKGDVSRFSIPSSREGNKQEVSFSAHIRTLIAVFGVFQKEDAVVLGVGTLEESEGRVLFVEKDFVRAALVLGA